MPVNGYNLWSIDGVSVGASAIGTSLDGKSTVLISSNSSIYSANVLDFSAGTPTGPSSVRIELSPDPASVLTEVAWLTLDANNRIWILNVPTPSGGSGIFLQSYDPSSGSFIGQADLESTVGFAPEGVDLPIDIGTGAGATPFLWDGEAYLLLFSGAMTSFDTDSEAWTANDYATLFNVNSGAPSRIGQTKFVCSNTDFLLRHAFFDGHQYLFFGVLRLDGETPPQAAAAVVGITIFKVDISGMAIAGSVFINGGYTFVGDPRAQTIYVTTLGGEVLRYDCASLALIDNTPLAGHLGSITQFRADLGGFETIDNSNVTSDLAEGNLCYNSHNAIAMTNPQFGAAVDTNGSQWLTLGAPCGSGISGGWNRIVDLTEDTADAEPFASWGASTDSSSIRFAFTRWVSSRQSLVWLDSHGIWEFLFTSVSNPCSGQQFEFR